MMRVRLLGKRRIAVCAGLAIGAWAIARPAYAHGFGQRYDLPVPLDYFLAGAAATVAFSFVVISLFVRRRSDAFSYPSYNLLGAPWLGAFLGSRVPLTAIQVLSVALFVLVIATAISGTSRSVENFSPTFVWIIWWVGIGYVTALLGNLWALVNPWKILFEWAEKVLGGGTTHEDRGLFRYPEEWDVWPAMLLFLAFAWLENVYSGAAEPFKLGLLVLLYSAITWGGMLAFGKHQWLRHGEAFTVLFGFFARFSPTEVRVADERVCRRCNLDCNLSGEGCVDCYECFRRADAHGREFNLRPYAVGLAKRERVSTATAVFVVLALATVTFDGFTATSPWRDFQSEAISAASAFGANAMEAVDTVGLVLLPVVFLSVYLTFSWAIRALLGTRLSVAGVARAFVFPLVPIALAYNLAHFISLLLIQGQLIIPLASDPFGSDWDLLGTADYRINIAVIGARLVWFISIAAIVVGHIVAVYIAHVIALRTAPNHTSALRSQYPMLVLMVFYTATSLWIIAQPIVN